MDRSLSPRDAAAKLGITTGTLIRWERMGRITSDRTPGNQRRYAENAVDALLNGRAAQSDRPRNSRFASPVRTDDLAESEEEEAEALDDDPDGDAAQDDSREESRPPGGPLGIQPWERRVYEARAELEVTKIRRERDALLKADEEQEQRRASEAERARELRSRNAAIERQADAEHQREERRLSSLRSTARLYVTASGAPVELQAAAARDVLSFITPDRFPSWLPDADAYQLIYTHVQEGFASWRAGVAATRAEGDRQQMYDTLLRKARSHALSRIGNWRRRDLERARKAVDRELAAHLDPAWTASQVQAFVDAVLDDCERR